MSYQESRYPSLRQDARPVTVIYTHLVADPVRDEHNSTATDRTTLMTDSGEMLNHRTQGLYEVRGTGELIICNDPTAP
jgi:hypothetical protein